MRCTLCKNTCEAGWLKYLQSRTKIKIPVCSLCVVKEGCKIIEKALRYAKKIQNNSPIKDKR